MVGRFLITTADQRTWKSEAPILFLGSWCKIFSERHFWQSEDSKTVGYHWDDRDQALKDYKYLNTLYEDVLKSLVKSLNSTHEVDHNSEYWRILIGPWLYYFCQIIFDRWRMIEIALKNYEIKETILLAINDRSMIPNDFADFERKYISDTWNNWIYGKILIDNNFTELNFNASSIQENATAPNKSKTLDIFKNALKELLELFQKLSKSNKVFIYQTLFTSYQTAKLDIKLGQLPMRFHEKEIKTYPDDQELRQTLIVDYMPKDEFEKFLIKMISIQIPKAYLEGYSDLDTSVNKFSWPKDPKAIISSSIISNDFFKCWAATRKEKGSKLIISQHGGQYGIGKWQSNELHERKIADLFLSWGWEGSNVKAIAASKISASKSRLRTNPKGGMLLSQAALPRYSYWMYSIPIAGQLEEYLYSQIIFARTLGDDLRKELTVKLYPKDFGWCQKDRWRNEIPDIKIAHDSMRYLDLVKKSRLNICTYNATTFLESLGSNVPTIMFWDPSFWEVRDSAVEDFENLRKAGILYNSPIEAANKVNDIWDTMDLWWSDKYLQKVRVNFCDKYARTSTQWLEEWDMMIKEIINS